MRIAYVCTDPGVPAYGNKGASVHVQSVLRVLLARGHEVHLITSRPGGIAPQGLEPVIVHPLPAVQGAGAPQRERSAASSDAHAAAVLDGLARCGGVDLVYERYSLWGATATAWAAASTVPSVLEVNAPLVQEQLAHRVLADRRGAEQVATKAVSAASAVVCVSAGVASWVLARTAHPERVHIIANGVDTERVQPSGRPPTPAHSVPFTVGFLGTLKPWHGVETLLDALVLLHRDDPGAYRLLLVGDGPEAPGLRQRADAAGVAGLVEHTGAVTPEQVPALLHRMDVATAPYPPMAECYFSPLKVYEYLAAGIPVVASAVGQLSDVLDGGRLGVLVQPGRADALAAAIAALRADEAFRGELSNRGRAAALHQHSWDGVVQAIVQLCPVPGQQRRAVP